MKNGKMEDNIKYEQIGGVSLRYMNTFYYLFIVAVHNTYVNTCHVILLFFIATIYTMFSPICT